MGKKRFTVTFEVDEGAEAPDIFLDCSRAVWAKGDERIIGGAVVVIVTTPQPVIEGATGDG